MKIDSKPRNSKNEPNGFWIDYFNTGLICYKGQYINGIQYGYFIDNWINKPNITFCLK